MLHRWGSWTRRGLIYLNPQLVLAPGSCVDYVVTHELCHLVHPSHGPDFFALLRRVMPDWVERKDRLERAAAETGVPVGG
jgi:predicted metal-dependent hydrolase